MSEINNIIDNLPDLQAQAFNTLSLVDRVRTRNESLADGEVDRLYESADIHELVETLREMKIFINQSMEGVDDGWIISQGRAEWFKTIEATEKSVKWVSIDLLTGVAEVGEG